MVSYYAYKGIGRPGCHPAHRKGLVGLLHARLVEKNDDKYFKLKPDMQLYFKENINNSAQRISQAIQ
jgi:hypothetical protein